MSKAYQVHAIMAAPVNGMYVSDPKKWIVAIVVAKIMNTPLSKIIGIYDTDAKIIACYHEMLFARMSYRDVSKKYSINRGYLKTRLSKLGQALDSNQVLKAQMKSIGRALFQIQDVELIN